MSKVIQHPETHHFADYTNLLYSSNLVKKLNRFINYNLKLIIYLHRANRISLNADKTEIITFRQKGKDITKKLNFSISSTQIYITKQVLYLGLKCFMSLLHGHLI